MKYAVRRKRRQGWLRISRIVAAIATFIYAFQTFQNILYVVIWVLAGTDYALTDGMTEGTYFGQTVGEIWPPYVTDFLGSGSTDLAGGWVYVWQAIYSYALFCFFDLIWRSLKEKMERQAIKESVLKTADWFFNSSKQRQAAKPTP